MNKDLKKILAALTDQGFTVTVTAKGRHQVTKGGQWVTTFGNTSGDHRALRNGIAAARRHGFRWPA